MALPDPPKSAEDHGDLGLFRLARMGRLRDLAMTVWGWSAIAVSTAFFGTLAILTCWIPPRGALYLFWARSWAKSLLVLTGIPARIEISAEAEALPQAIYMSNHESGIDILLLFLSIRQDVRFLAKRELFLVPFMGWSMWLAGFVPVDRMRTEKAKHVLSELDRRLAEGISVLIFPEGTRSRDGTLGSFKKSGFLTALKSGVPIVPGRRLRRARRSRRAGSRHPAGAGAREGREAHPGERTERQGQESVDGRGPKRDCFS